MSEIYIENITFSYPDFSRPIFKNFDLSLPGGITSLVGRNGTGKTTLLLIASGILLPQKGRVTICGNDSTSLRDEKERHRYISFIYQNMEFETKEDIEVLLHQVYETGFHEKKDDNFIETLIDVFELKALLKKKSQEVSKGELQRTILAFSLLYGSKIIIMDEPIFAMENYQKDIAMGFIYSYAKENGICIIYSVHELDIAIKFSDNTLLFFKDGSIKLGPTKDILTKENLEAAYQFPFSLMKRKDMMYRIQLKNKFKKHF